MKRRSTSISTSVLLCVSFLTSLLVVFLTVIVAKAAVTLLYFIATGADEQVILRWETATELDNAGFFVNRSTQPDNNFVRVNPTIIPARGDGLTGAIYEFRDLDVINGVIYWYQLESIDLSQHSEYFEAVSVVPGGTPGATGSATVAATLTLTQQAAPTSISTPGQPTSRPQQTLLPTPTPTPSMAATLPQTLTTQPGSGGQPSTTPTPPVQGSQPPDSLVSEPIGTLVPFPSITVQFPSTNTPLGAVPVEDQPVPPPTRSGNSTPLLLLAVVILAWLVLGGWFLVVNRRLS